MFSDDTCYLQMFFVKFQILKVSMTFLRMQEAEFDEIFYSDEESSDSEVYKVKLSIDIFGT